jgi:dolichol-phosphate mannosyltransferase
MPTASNKRRGRTVPNTIVVIPTYCELKNLRPIVDRILAAAPDVSILVVDDNSPDGTGALADQLALEHKGVHVLHRLGKEGLGAAYRAGFDWALEREYSYIMEMDADGSHQPEQLPSLIAALDNGADLVIGTRWMPGGEVVNWPLRRQALSQGGTAFARLMLHSKLRDITSGYRGFRARELAQIDADSSMSQGYCFQIELAWHVERSGARIAEVPITFVERTEGTSKMSISIIVEAMWSVFVWGVQSRLAPPQRQRARA